MATKKETKKSSAGEKIGSYLPIFSGFYNTIFEAQEDTVIEEPYEFDDYDFDYKEYNESVAKECVKVVGKWLKDFDIKVKFEEVVSPKYYNYSNDSINVEYELGEDSMKKILDYLEENKEAFSEYIKKKYTSRDGFMSSYSNDSNEWISDLKDEKSLHHKLGAVLEFILENEGHDENELYDEISGNVYLSGELSKEAKERQKAHEEFREKVGEIARKGYAKKSQSEVVDAIVKHLEGKEADYDRDEIEGLVKKAYADIEGQTASMFSKGGKASSGLKSFIESYSTDGGLVFGGYFGIGSKMEKGGKAEKFSGEWWINDLIDGFENKDSEGEGILGTNKSNQRVAYVYRRRNPKYMHSHKYGVKVWHPLEGWDGKPASSTSYRTKEDAINSLSLYKGIAERNKELGFIAIDESGIIPSDSYGKGGKVSKDGDKHAYYIKAWKKEEDYNKKKKPDLEEKKSLNWDEAHERQMSLEESYFAVGIFAKKDNREVSISLGEVQ